jgi:hypothetical protein
MAAAGRRRRYEAKHRLLGLIGLMAALRLSGSSLFTLGLASSARGAPRW